MKVIQPGRSAADFGNNEFREESVRSGRSQKWLIAIFICFYIFIAFLADGLWLSKKSYFATHTESFKNFTILHPVPYHSWYATGGGGQENRSLPYMVLLRLVYSVVHNRILSLRVTSVIVTGLSLFFLYRLSVILFCRPIGLIFIFLLVTSPIYVEGMRAFGYQSLTHLVVVMVCYLIVATQNNRKVVIKIALLAFCCVLTMPLYVAGRIVTALPLLFFGFYGKKNWPKLLLFIVLFVGFILILELSFGSPILNVKEYFYAPQEQAGIWISGAGKLEPALLCAHLRNNLRLAKGYLLNQDRSPFLARSSNSRLFNVVYTPFLFLGSFVCFWKRKKSNIFLLLMLLLFFFVPMGSKEIQPRRILLALYPLYLMIALGLWFAFKTVSGFSDARAWRSAVKYFSLIGLLAVGGCDIHEFLFKVAKPHYHFSREQLKKVAAFITSSRKKVDHIRYHKTIDELIMGNPYFITHPKKDLKVANIFGEERYDMKPCLITFLTGVGEDLLYLYTVPAPPHFRAAVEWAKKNLSDIFYTSSISGTNLHYVLLTYSAVAPNLIFRAGEDLKLTTSLDFTTVKAEDSVHSSLIDGRMESSWEFLLTGCPPPVGVIFDFGEGNEHSVKSLVARPSLDKLEYFFRQAALWGSTDGKTWEMVAPIIQESPPATTDWIRWNFNNPRSYRYYKFEIYKTEEQKDLRLICIGDLLLFDRSDRQLYIEDFL